MKNLPNKIYLNFNMTPQEVAETKDKDFHEATKTWEITWSEERLSEHDPVYVRKDAPTEKDCQFCKKNPLSDSVLAAIEQSLDYHSARGDDFRIDEQIEIAYRYGFESGVYWKEQQNQSTIELKEVDLDWENVRELCVLSAVVELEKGRSLTDQEHYTEVIKRFKAQKGE